MLQTMDHATIQRQVNSDGGDLAAERSMQARSTGGNKTVPCKSPDGAAQAIEINDTTENDKGSALRLYSP